MLREDQDFPKSKPSCSYGPLVAGAQLLGEAEVLQLAALMCAVVAVMLLERKT